MQETLLLFATDGAADHMSIIIVADDSIFVLTVHCTKTRILDVTKTCAAISHRICAALLGMHTFTGCDTVSALSGQGKLKALKLFIDNTTFQSSDSVFLIIYFKCTRHSLMHSFIDCGCVIWGN